VSPKGCQTATKTEFINVLIHEGRIVIADYTENNDRKGMLVGLNAAGIDTTIQTESWCG